jgi:hypothetical protein
MAAYPMTFNPTNSFSFAPQAFGGPSNVAAPGFQSPASAFAAPQGMDQNMIGAQSMMLATMTEMLMMLLSMMGAQGSPALPFGANNAADAMQQAPSAVGAPSSYASPSAGSGSAPASGSQAASQSSAAAPVSGPLSTSDFGKRFAKTAEATANKINTPGLCLKGVNDSMQAMGINPHRHPSAYMALDDFRKDPHFKEVSVSKSQLDKLPAGAVVIWGQGQGLPHGHISVALGDGREASSRVRKQLHLNSQYHVFLPK